MSLFIAVVLSSVLIAGGLHLQGIAQRRRFNRRNEHGVQSFHSRTAMQSEVVIDTLLQLGGVAFMGLGVGGIPYGAALYAFAR
ncbi:hypothetical protein D3867_37030 (plasmid) [Azospirillum argentinense]|uniref:Uncharacterized protein n=1 Tax=Azospirillum brasilense TaxID=192 RepID=A0A4D8QE30_AZOBR|nr:hypothetical protein D3867_37030 [Azospirillum argentinense]